MTSATERLRELLDERGVEWKAIDGDDMCFTEWRTHGGAFVYTARESFRSYGDNDLHVETCGIPRSCLIATPEQAIAATLESDGEYERKMDALLCRLTNGKFSKTRTYDLDFMESVVREEFETECVSEPGTCQMKLLWSNIDAGACFECSACGGIISTFGPEPRFCSKCGCRVEAVVK